MAASSDSTLFVGSSRKVKKSLFYLVTSLFLFSISSILIMLYPSDTSILIHEPISTLKLWCLSYGALECGGYCLLVRLQRDDGFESSLSSGKKTKGGSTKLHGIISALKSSVKYGILLGISCLLFHTVAVLYGAPLLETVGETAIFATLLTTLVTLPTFCVLGTDGEKYVRLIGSRRPDPGLETCLTCIVLLSLCGAWLGAFPIPLDWGRPWQVWPVSCCIGALCGHVVGLGASVVQCGRLLGQDAELTFSRSKSKNY